MDWFEQETYPEMALSLMTWVLSVHKRNIWRHTIREADNHFQIKFASLLVFGFLVVRHKRKQYIDVFVHHNLMIVVGKRSLFRIRARSVWSDPSCINLVLLFSISLFFEDTFTAHSHWAEMEVNVKKIKRKNDNNFHFQFRFFSV